MYGRVGAGARGRSVDRGADLLPQRGENGLEERRGIHRPRLCLAVEVFDEGEKDSLSGEIGSFFLVSLGDESCYSVDLGLMVP